MTTAAENEDFSRKRPHGVVRGRLVAAAIELARVGGPDAVVLREVTRRVGVASNAAYRHFADRDELLYAVCVHAMRLLADRMVIGVREVRPTSDARRDARARVTAVGRSYLDFARAEPGLFRTAFAVPDHLPYADDPGTPASAGPTPLDVLNSALDDAVTAGAIAPERRPFAQFVAWSAVHGYATLRQDGPLRQAPDDDAARIERALLDTLERAL